MIMVAMLFFSLLPAPPLPMSFSSVFHDHYFQRLYCNNDYHNYNKTNITRKQKRNYILFLLIRLINFLGNIKLAKGFNILLVLFIWQLSDINVKNTVLAAQRGRLIVPVSYVAQSNDLQIQLVSYASLTKYDQDLRLQITRMEASGRVTVGVLDVFPDPFLNVTQITISCQYFIRGGTYELEIVGNDINSTLDNRSNDRLRQYLDVRWPVAHMMATTNTIATYPNHSVKVHLEFEGVECQRIDPSLADLPEFWLELVYCGQETICDSANVTTKSQILYTEPLRGLVSSKIIELSCDLFGLAGNYIFQLKPISPTPSYVKAAVMIRADWSEKFVFNVHAHSIFPCEPHSGGIGVLFEYPACILDQSDRVRLYAKLRADVASLSPPTSLHYITEQRVIKGQHSLHFDCELFTEKYVEYCFVYVSQAISGAVADVRMDCVPTLPVKDSDTGGWSPFSNWSACSTNCGKGVRYRYRFCDSPPPRYGAKFCEGPSVETEACYGIKNPDSFECLYGEYDKTVLEHGNVMEEIGPACRCGCIIHLGKVKSKRVIASSAQACPGRTFWLIQADEGHQIQFKLDFFRLPCSNQYLRVRDGDTLQADLIGGYIGGMENNLNVLESTGPQLLIEFFSDDLTHSNNGLCGGGFLGHATQIKLNSIANITVSAIIKNPIQSHKIKIIDFKLTLAHLAAIVFVCFISLISLLLGIQYIFRYHKYEKTSREPDSPSHTPTVSHPASRAMSTTTLISEVISMVKLRPKLSVKHARLRESVDVDNLENQDGHEMEQLKSSSTNTLKASTSHDELNPKNNNLSKTFKLVNKRLEKLGLNNQNESTSLPELPMDTPILNKKRSELKEIDIPKSAENFEIKKLNTKPNCKDQQSLTPSPNDRNSFASDASEKKDEERSLTASTSMGSNSTLTNGCYSPAFNMASKAVISRANNPKESKEKKNREKLMATTGSEFSLSNPEELEMDYYDYNVINSAAAPGSYLGMDPAFLVWIPPIDEGDVINEMERNEPHYEEILPRESSTDDLSCDTEKTFKVPPKPPRRSISSSYQTNQEIKALLSKSPSDKHFDDDDKKSSDESIQMSELTPRKHLKQSIEVQKETTISLLKATTDNRIADFYGLSDIQFADDVDDVYEEARCIDENRRIEEENTRYKV
uniref:CSON003189 protein n=1 Tax=Culicoides sonorensis TaxID=179676 RepID=A0A336L527_CULSO